MRHADGPRESRWWRLHPERWLESLVVKNICALDDQLDPRWRYSQVPAFSASDRAMIDVLTLTREGRRAVLELKADEDIHLPLQGIELLVASVIAPFARRVPEIRILLPARTFGSRAAADNGGARIPRTSCNRHVAAIYCARDRMDAAGN